MSKTIPFTKLAAHWRKDPAFMREYDALEEEFALAHALIKARADAGLTQEELAVLTWQQTLDCNAEGRIGTKAEIEALGAPAPTL